MMEWIAVANAYAALAESRAATQALAAADTPEKKEAFFRVMAQRYQRQHELAVARASAPVVNIVNKTYVW